MVDLAAGSLLSAEELTALCHRMSGILFTLLSRTVDAPALKIGVAVVARTLADPMRPAGVTKRGLMADCRMGKSSVDRGIRGLREDVLEREPGDHLHGEADRWHLRKEETKEKKAGSR